MSDAEKPLLADVRAEFEGLAGEMREMVAARWELAGLELQADLRLAKRLAALLIAAAAMMFTAAPLLVFVLADRLDGCYELARNEWLLIFACGLLVLSLATSLIGWLCFRRRFTGLKETIEELREDAVWIREKFG